MADYDNVPYIVVERGSGGLSSFFLGALIGAGLALLYAPRPGEETRRQLRDRAQRLRETAEETTRQLREAVTGTLDDLREQVTDRVDTARRAVDVGRTAARRTRSDLERRIREAQAEFRTAEEPAAEPDEPDARADGQA
ncbi:MAG TPA: YtxH domain-containing protein [Longimicrobiales bacterium]